MIGYKGRRNPTSWPGSIHGYKPWVLLNVYLLPPGPEAHKNHGKSHSMIMIFLNSALFLHELSHPVDMYMRHMYKQGLRAGRVTLPAISPTAVHVASGRVT